MKPSPKRPKPPPDPFRWFDSSPEVIRLVVMMYVRYPLSLRNVEDLLFERGIDICHETVRLIAATQQAQSGSEAAGGNAVQRTLLAPPLPEVGGA